MKNDRNHVALRKKLRHIEIATSRLATDQMAGQYRSVFKGRGMSFEEVRPYQAGDDIRQVDWNVSARTGDLHVKLFVEERELTVFLLVDASRSACFGTRGMTRQELQAEVGALLAFSAIKNNDRVGLIIFTDKVEHIVPPRKGRLHVMRVIMDILRFEPARPGAAPGGVSEALRTLVGVTKKTSVAFLLSDFFIKSPAEFEGLRRSLAIAKQRHDLVPLVARDPADLALPPAGLVTVADPETGALRLVDFSSKGVRKRYSAAAAQADQRLTDLFRAQGLDFETIRTDQDYMGPMLRLFRRRARRS
ncbi:MAG: DUF58 domain-containing protein [Pseudomonadota bacterium]